MKRKQPLISDWVIVTEGKKRKYEYGRNLVLIWELVWPFLEQDLLKDAWNAIWDCVPSIKPNSYYKPHRPSCMGTPQCDKNLAQERGLIRHYYQLTHHHKSQIVLTENYININLVCKKTCIFKPK